MRPGSRQSQSSASPFWPNLIQSSLPATLLRTPLCAAISAVQSAFRESQNQSFAECSLTSAMGSPRSPTACPAGTPLADHHAWRRNRSRRPHWRQWGSTPRVSAPSAARASSDVTSSAPSKPSDRKHRCILNLGSDIVNQSAARRITRVSL